MIISIFKKTQVGAAAAISIFILLVVIAGMLTTALYSSSSSISNSIQQQDYQKALFLAETGVQVAQFEMDDSSVCGYTTTQNYASGSFEITVSDPNGSDGCDITVIGKSNGVISTFNRKILFASTGGGGTFLEPFPNSGDYTSEWQWGNITSNDGNDRWDSDNCDATCTEQTPTGGSFYAEAFDGGGWFGIGSYVGYRERSLDTTINTGSGLTIDLTGGFKKGSTNKNPWVQDLTIKLINSSTGDEFELWKDTKRSNKNQWKAIAETNTLPASTSYDRVRIEFNLLGLSRGYPLVWIDEIKLVW